MLPQWPGYRTGTYDFGGTTFNIFQQAEQLLSQELALKSGGKASNEQKELIKKLIRMSHC